MHRERGFTLVEVLVALVIAAIVVTLAQKVFASATEGVATLLAARRALDRSANARRLLKVTFLSLEIGSVGGTAFDGGPDRAAFSAWELTDGGWFELRRIELAVQDSQLVLRLRSNREIALEDSVVALSVDYLLRPGADARWARRWVSPGSAPLAVRLRIAGLAGAVDTLLFLIGSRG